MKQHTSEDNTLHLMYSTKMCLCVHSVQQLFLDPDVPLKNANDRLFFSKDAFCASHLF